MNGGFNPQQIYAAHFCAAFFNYPLTKELKYVIIYSVKSVEENKVALSVCFQRFSVWCEEKQQLL
jgi:hypothetical protein